MSIQTPQNPSSSWNKTNVFQAALYIVAMLSSWALTAGGIVSLLTEIDAPAWVLYAAAGLISAVLQAGIGALWSILGRGFSARKNIPVLIIFLLPAASAFSLMSWTFSTGSTVALTDPDGVQSDLNRNAAEPAMRAAQIMRNDVANLRTKLTQLSALATERAKLERTAGGSCGPSPGLTCGPICELRNLQSQDALNLANGSTALTGKMTEVELQAGLVSDQAEATAISTTLRNLQANTQIADIALWLDHQKAGFADKFREDLPRYGLREIACTDPQFERALNSTSEAVDQLQSRELPQIILQEASTSLVINENFALLQEGIGLLLGGGSAEEIQAYQDNPRVKRAKPAWAFSLLIELACAFLAVADGYRSHFRLGQILGSSTGLPRHQQLESKEILDLLRLFRVHSGRQDYFAAPRTGIYAGPANNLAITLALREIPVDLVDHYGENNLLPNDIMDRLRTGGGSRWRVFTDPKGKLAELERDLTAAVGIWSKFGGPDDRESHGHYKNGKATGAPNMA